MEEVFDNQSAKKPGKKLTITLIILLALFIVAAGSLALLFIQSNSDLKQTRDDLKSSQNQVKDLQNQREKSNESNSTNQPGTAKYMEISQWNIKFVIPEGLSDLKYQIFNDKDEVWNIDAACIIAKPTGFDVEFVANVESNMRQYCMEVVYRSQDPTRSRGPSSAGIEDAQGRKIGNYYYYTAWSFSGLASGRAYNGIFGWNGLNDGQNDPAWQAEDKASRLVSEMVKTIQVK